MQSTSGIVFVIASHGGVGGPLCELLRTGQRCLPTVHLGFTSTPKTIDTFLHTLATSNVHVERYMAKLSAPVHTTTMGGFRAVVTDLTRRHTNQLDGYLLIEGVPVSATWSFAGICAAGDERFDLEMSKPEHQCLRKYPARHYS
jgi:hypothetical protein